MQAPKAEYEVLLLQFPGGIIVTLEESKAVSEPPLGLTNVEEATSGAADSIEHIDSCAGEPLSDAKSLFGALNGSERGGVGADSNHNSVKFKIVMEKDKNGPEMKLLSWLTLIRSDMIWPVWTGNRYFQ
eukprot:g34309.t1